MTHGSSKEGPWVEIEGGARWRMFTLAAIAGYSTFEDSDAKLLDLPPILGDYHASQYDLGVRGYLHISWAFVGAGFMFEDWHERGTFTKYDVVQSTYELHDKYTFGTFEVHAGVTLPKIKGLIAPQILAMITSASDVDSTDSIRLAIGAQF